MYTYKYKLLDDMKFFKRFVSLPEVMSECIKGYLQPDIWDVFVFIIRKELIKLFSPFYICNRQFILTKSDIAFISENYVRNSKFSTLSNKPEKKIEKITPSAGHVYKIFSESNTRDQYKMSKKEFILSKQTKSKNINISKVKRKNINRNYKECSIDYNYENTSHCEEIVYEVLEKYDELCYCSLCRRWTRWDACHNRNCLYDCNYFTSIDRQYYLE